MELRELVLSLLGAASLNSCLNVKRENEIPAQLIEQTTSISREPILDEEYSNETLDMRVLRDIVDGEFNFRISKLAGSNHLLRAHAQNLKDKIKRDIASSIGHIEFFLRVEQERFGDSDGTIYYKLGQAYERAGNLEKALGFFIKARESGKNLVWQLSTIEYGRTLLQLMEKSRESEDFVNGIRYATAFLKLEDEVRAATDSNITFLKSENIEDNERLCIEFAIEYANRKKFDAAEFFLLMALSNNRNNSKTHSMLAELYCLRGNLDEAEKEVRKVLSLNSNYKGAHANLAVILRDKGDKESALYYFKEAISREPDNVDFINDTGVLHLELGRERIAQKYFQDALERKPNEKDYLRNFSTALLLDEKLEEVLDEEKLKVLSEFLHARINLKTAEEKGYDVKRIARNLELLGDIFYRFKFEEEWVLFFKCNIAAQYFDFSEERAKKIEQTYEKIIEKRKLRPLVEIYRAMISSFDVDAKEYDRIIPRT